MGWEVKQIGKIPVMKDAVLIEGLPGIGNVGKVVVDFLIEELDAKRIYEFFSYSLPHSVFVNENNLVDLPKIEMSYARTKNGPLLLLAGDTQPADEVSSYSFSEEIVNIAKKNNTKEIITLGGSGLPTIPDSPKVYCTGNSKKLIKKHKNGTNIDDNLFGVVGPIIGVSGLLLGMAKRTKVDALTLLAETYSHPLYIGVKGAREILEVLNKNLDVKLDMGKIDDEIDDIEDEIGKRSKKLKDVARHTAMAKGKQLPTDTSYIG